MTDLRQTHTFLSAVLTATCGFAAFAISCTPATENDLSAIGGGGATAAGGTPGANGGTPANPATGGTGATAAGGTSEPEPGGGGKASGGDGGANPMPGGGAASTGGATSPGGATSMGGAGGMGGAVSTEPMGCHWTLGPNDTLTMNPPEAEKVMLFDGTSLDGWHKLNEENTPAHWQLLNDGTMEVVPLDTPTNIQSKMKFENVCLHVEYMTPVFPSNVSVQRQGNSGIFLKSAYEMQILDTSQLGAIDDGCGAVYKIAPPFVVACNQFLEWNTYEIEFKASEWDAANQKTANAMFVQVTLNGKLVQKDVILDPAGGFTQAGIPDVAGPQPISLQDHRDLVRFRNIWVTIPRY